MIKRCIVVFLILAMICSFIGCNNNELEKEISTQTEAFSEEIAIDTDATEELYYEVSTEWMTFFFSKKDFNESEILEISAEAESVMQDIRDFFSINYTLEVASGTVCYFDSSYRTEKNEKRSMCFCGEKKLCCVYIGDFIHEYVHMVSGSNSDLVYYPSDIFEEGLAEYISLIFDSDIATKKYDNFKSPNVLKSVNDAEHQILSELLSSKGLAYNQRNYKKAFVAMLYKNYDISKMDKNSDGYKYYVGYVFAEYCVEQLGGLEKFMNVYSDSVTVVDVYGKSLDEIVMEACAYNMTIFYGI